MNENKCVTKNKCNADKYKYRCSNCGNQWNSPLKIKSIDKIYNRDKKYPHSFDCKDKVIENPDGTYEIIHIRSERIVTDEELEEYEKKPLFKTVYRYTGLIDKCPRCIVGRKESEEFRRENKLHKIRTDKKPIWEKKKTTRERVKRWRAKQKEVIK
jgi:hypothetical protein